MAEPVQAPLSTFADQIIVNGRQHSDTRTLASLWAEGPVVLVFIRRLGCALCRTTCKEYTEGALKPLEAMGVRLICISFELPGEGSDSDGSFFKGGYWGGDLYVVDPSVHKVLFGSKSLFSGFYGLCDVSKTKLQSCTENGVTGNLKGGLSGLTLGGTFVVKKGGEVVVDHRQKFFGDDLAVEELIEAGKEVGERGGVGGGGGGWAAAALDWIGKAKGGKAKE